jgi:dTDP-4-dehydrorhamnose reductase
VIVSAAAFTAVDKAEAERDAAFAVNQAGAAAIATAARRLDVPLIHLSTDYVFDGTKPDPYVESDPTGPTGVYGASKLAGEEAVLAAHDNVAILRTAWVYSPFGANFVKTMLRLAADRDEVSVVADQRGNPSSALDLADGIIAVAANMLASSDPARRGIFHMTGRGDASWAEFAAAIFEASAAGGGPSARVKPIGTADYPTPARRPANSRLAGDKLARAHHVRLPEWRQSTATIVARLVRGDA